VSLVLQDRVLGKAGALFLVSGELYSLMLLNQCM
jgi:hypothetical protein